MCDADPCVVRSHDRFGGLPAGTPAAFEAAYGWGWLVELLDDYSFEPHLVHPLRCKAIASAQLKNDKGRCGDPGAAAAGGSAARGVDRPLEVRQLRALLRHRAGLVRLRTQLQNRIHAVAATTAMTARPATGPTRAAAGCPGWQCPRSRGRSSPTAWHSPAPSHLRSIGSTGRYAPGPRRTRG